MDEVLLVRVLTRLVRVHAEFGETCFEEAVKQALLGIARAAQAEADQRAAAIAAQHGPKVVVLRHPTEMDRSEYP